MRFSILIPVYNVEKYIDECLNSILQQDFRSYEIILVDDGSTDDSGMICDAYQRDYPDRVKVIHQKNKGLFATRRVAFTEASGEYCICVDSDDFIEAGSLQLLSDVIETHAPDFILYGWNFYIDSVKKPYDEVLPFAPSVKYNSVDSLRQGLICRTFTNWSMCTKCIKTEVAQADFDYSKYYHISYGEDTFQSMVLYNNARSFMYLDAKIYNYRMGSGMTSKKPIKCLSDFYEISRAMSEICVEWTEDINKDSADFFTRVFFSYIDECIKYSDTMKEAGLRAKDADDWLKSNCKTNINYGLCTNKIKRWMISHGRYGIVYLLWKIKWKITGRR